MFQGCTALTQAPALPATTLAVSCYGSMFKGCTALTQAPALPATTLAVSCYDSMFQGCTALTQAPALPATKLAIHCYIYMFQGCTALTQAPALPATKLEAQCYRSMFSGCTSLKLSSTKTDEYTQEYRIPSSGDSVTASNSLFSMFASTGGTFTGTPAINTTYYLSSDNMIVCETEVATLNGYVGSMIDFAIGEYAESAEYIIPSSTEGSTKKFKLSVDDSGTIKTTNTDDSVEVQFARTSDIPTVDSTLTKSGQAADASEVGKEIRTVSGKIPTVFDWAKKELFDKADLVDPAGINSFLTIDGVEYYRYHCGPNNFEWNNPKPYPGSVTITARAVSQYGGTNGTRLLTIYDDGTYGPTLYVIVGGESKTVTVTTDPDKTLAKITGNYDMENWALLDMSVMSCVANYNTGLPLANSNAPGGVIADPVTEEYTVPAKIGKDGKMYVPDIPVVDATLTKSGQAADAAKVGEELRSLSSKMVQSVNNQQPDENGNVTVEAGGGETAFTLIDSGEIEDGTVSLEFGNLEKYSEITCCFSLIRNNNNSSSGVSLYVNEFNIVSGGNYFIVYNHETYPTISIKKVSENRILCMANGAGLNNPYNVNDFFNSIHPIPNNETELRSIKIVISKSGVTFTAGSTFEIWGR